MRHTKNKVKSVLRWGGLELRAEAKLAKTQNYQLERQGEQRQHRTQDEECLRRMWATAWDAFERSN